MAARKDRSHKTTPEITSVAEVPIEERPLEVLVLVRSLPSDKVPTRAQLLRDLAPLFRAPLDTAALDVALRELVSSGALDAAGKALRASGRERALRWLGIAEADLEKKPTWSTIKGRLLPARALGLASPEADVLLKSKAKLTAVLLKRALRLPPTAGETVAAVLEALACRELGHPEHSSLDALMSDVCSRAIGAPQTLTGKELLVQTPRLLLGGRGSPADLREALLRGFADANDPLDLASFARMVLDAALQCPTGRFGEDKVFVSHLWRYLQQRGSSLGVDDFKARLVSANTAGLLSLGRADLVQRMDPQDVSRSEIHAMGAVFHFVIARRGEGRSA